MKNSKNEMSVKVINCVLAFALLVPLSSHALDIDSYDSGLQSIYNDYDSGGGWGDSFGGDEFGNSWGGDYGYGSNDNYNSLVAATQTVVVRGTKFRWQSQEEIDRILKAMYPVIRTSTRYKSHYENQARSNFILGSMLTAEDLVQDKIYALEMMMSFIETNKQAPANDPDLAVVTNLLAEAYADLNKIIANIDMVREAVVDRNPLEIFLNIDTTQQQQVDHVQRTANNLMSELHKINVRLFRVKNP